MEIGLMNMITRMLNWAVYTMWVNHQLYCLCTSFTYT